MSECYLIRPMVSNRYIISELQRRGIKVYSCGYYDDHYFLIKYFLNCIEDTEEDLKIAEDYLLNKINFVLYNKKYLDSIERKNILDCRRGDYILTFSESHLFQSSVLSRFYKGVKFMSPSTALTIMCKHLYYKKLNIPFLLLRKREDLDSIPWDNFYIKRSVCSGGKLNCHRYNKKEINKISNNIFMSKPYIAQPEYKFKEEVWCFTFFSDNFEPRVLFYSTEKETKTFYYLEEKILENLRKISKKLKLNRWFAYVQFLVHDNNDITFIDLNPRLPGDDDWHEDVCLHLRNESLGKLIVDLLMHGSMPKEIKNNKIILESEYIGEQLESNQKMYNYSDGYKQRPLLTFK